MLLYFSTRACHVCDDLLPKITHLIKNRFSLIHLLEVDSQANPQLAALYDVFAPPVLLVFFEGREAIRRSRFVGIEELASLLSRPYELLFS